MEGTAAAPRTPLLAVFGNRSFSLLWTAQLISSMGSAVTTLAASILVYRLTGSALSVGLMLMATAAPTLLVGLAAGVFVDRYDRKRILLAADLLRAVLIVLVPWLTSFHQAWLYIIVLLSSAVSQFFEPAQASVLPDVASDAELAAANSLMAVSSVASTTLGYAAAGVIAAQFPIAWAFYIDGVTFLVSAALIAFVKIPPLAAEADTSLASVIRNLRAGLGAISFSASLRSLFLLFVPVFLIFGLQNTLFLPFAMRTLKATEFEYGVQQAVEAIGIAGGSLLMIRYADRLPEGRWLLLSFFFMALQSIWYSTANSVLLAIALVGLSGLLNAPSYIARQLIIQRQCPREARGRVNSAFFVVRDLMFLGGMALAGLADLMDVRQLFLFSALALLAVALCVPFLPGLGQTVTDWRRSLGLLKRAAGLPAVGPGRPATLADLEGLGRHLSVLSILSQDELRDLTAASHVLEAPAGSRLVRQGDTSDCGYFVLAGRTAAGRREGARYRILQMHLPGDFFGEIAAITGAPRSADVVADEDCRLLVVPADDLLKLTDHPEFNQLFLSTMRERLTALNLLGPLGFGIADQSLLRYLRTRTPDQPGRQTL